MGKRWDVIADLVNQNGLRSGAEIGVAEGRFTAALLRLCPHVTLWAIDHWPADYPTADGGVMTAERQRRIKAQFASIIAANRARLGIIEKPSLQAAKEIVDGALDFVFIDADHSYEGCLADIRAWMPKIRSGGWMTGHDYGHWAYPGVRQAVSETFPDHITGTDFTWMARL